MFYNVYTNQEGKVMGFIVDDNIPVEYETEKEAEEVARGHILEHFIITLEFVSIEDV